MNKSRQWGSGRGLNGRARRSATVGGLPRQVAWAERIGEERERKRSEAERLRIARELHDVMAYGFAAISIQAAVATRVMDERPEQVVEALDAITTASRQALDELRVILGTLRDADDDRGPTPGLREIDALVELTTKSGVRTSIEVSGAVETLPVAVDTAVYRIVQEALANVLRHSGADSASIRVVFENDSVVLSVEDDGCGNTAGAVSSGCGYGMAGIRERVAALGGLLEAETIPEGGFRVRASLPLAAAA